MIGLRKSVASITSSLVKMADDLLVLADAEEARGNDFAMDADIAKAKCVCCRKEGRKAAEVAAKIRDLVA